MAEKLQYKQYTELDFEQNKEKLKLFLKSQDQFKDFDFEGSAISVILNVLSQNTQLLSYYLNMMASEKFISTAQKRESVVGSADNIGYIPFSKKSPSAYLNFTINPDDDFSDNIFFPKNTKFSTTIDGINYQYLTTENTVVVPVSGIYTVTDMEVKEGRFFTHQYSVNSGDKFFKIPNKNVDTNRITIRVKESDVPSDSKEYVKYTDLIDTTPTSEIYYIKESINGTYDIYFGDGILGKSLSVGNVLIIEYYVTTGSLSNGARSFILEDEVSGLTSVTFVSVEASSGGANEESLDSIRISAPNNKKAAGRAVIEADYEALIKQVYPIAKKISVVGGERYTPRQYGKVFISILKETLGVLSDKDKNFILGELKKRYNGLTVFPEIVDPYIIRMLINVSVEVADDGVSTNFTKNLVTNVISDFVETDLNTFKYVLRKSKFEGLIDDSSPSILSNVTKFTLYINTNDVIIPTKNSFINFYQQIKPKSLKTNTFIYNMTNNCQIIDVDGLGVASVYIVNTDLSLTLVKKDVMKINYVTGMVNYIDNTISLHTLALNNLSGIKFQVSTVSEDIKIIDNSVVFVKNDDISVTINVEAKSING